MYDEDLGMTTGFNPMSSILFWVLMIIVIVGMWKMFEKAGKPGWASLIPIYNFIVLLEIVGKPLWWIVLMFIPIVNIIFAIRSKGLIMFDLS